MAQSIEGLWWPKVLMALPVIVWFQKISIPPQHPPLWKFHQAAYWYISIFFGLTAPYPQEIPIHSVGGVWIFCEPTHCDISFYPKDWYKMCPSMHTTQCCTKVHCDPWPNTRPYIALLQVLQLDIKWIKMVHFKLGNEMWKVNWSTWYKCVTKKNLSPQQESNPWPPEHRVGAVFTELEHSWRAKSFNWVHVWQASCILLESALPMQSHHE